MSENDLLDYLEKNIQIYIMTYFYKFRMQSPLLIS